MCGEKDIISNTVKNSIGSPPHVRGKAFRYSITCSSLGITPACAGKSSVRELLLIVSRDHPRMCGEKSTQPGHLWDEWGSPPHVRGKAPSLRERRHWHRITPACAGKRGLRSAWGSVYRDHPRMCGEKWITCRTRSARRGSPPHVRGKGHGIGIAVSRLRITPACAGKRGREVRRKSGNQDHPRMCGEKTSMMYTRKGLPGSPPHVRGKA